jgi:transcription elongation factor GreB
LEVHVSRAFVREIDDAPPEVQERPVSAAPNRVTPRGASLIAGAITSIEQQLAASSDQDATANLRRDLRYWLSRQASMQIHPYAVAPTAAGFATSVAIRRGNQTRTVSIVGEDEANPAAGFIAWTAPLARALDGAEPGDEVELDAAGHRDVVVILAVAAIGNAA